MQKLKTLIEIGLQLIVIIMFIFILAVSVVFFFLGVSEIYLDIAGGILHAIGWAVLAAVSSYVIYIIIKEMTNKNSRPKVGAFIVFIALIALIVLILLLHVINYLPLITNH